VLRPCCVQNAKIKPHPLMPSSPGLSQLICGHSHAAPRPLRGGEVGHGNSTQRPCTGRSRRRGEVPPQSKPQPPPSHLTPALTSDLRGPWQVLPPPPPVPLSVATPSSDHPPWRPAPSSLLGDEGAPPHALLPPCPPAASASPSATPSPFLYAKPGLHCALAWPCSAAFLRHLTARGPGGGGGGYNLVGLRYSRLATNRCLPHAVE
jgi:hypothetical protein